MRFSERMGIVKASNIIQKDDMNDDLRMDLWNTLYLFIDENNCSSEQNEFCIELCAHFFKSPVDEMGYFQTIKKIKNYVNNENWFCVYDLLEFVANASCSLCLRGRNDFIEKINQMLERNNSAYRFVGTQIACITDDTEIKEIETAQENPRSNVQTHINTALGFLSDRQNPDYRNSIKESISAVEALCREITGESTLDKALPALEKKGVEIPNMLRKSFEHFYHFTNDKNGIRHALMDEEQIGFEEAKYMLVLCSAFVNYLQAKLA